MTTSVNNISFQDHSVTWSFPPSDFNGKEKDYESGFLYYGARYYWSEVLTGWQSVDPMADKYPDISPYAYCVWNPVKLVDPDGNEPWYRLISGYDRNNAPKAPTPSTSPSRNNYFPVLEKQFFLSQEPRIIVPSLGGAGVGKGWQKKNVIPHSWYSIRN